MQPFITPSTALVIVGVLSILLLSFGFFISKKLVKNSSDFLYAGRNVGLAFSTATLIAAWVTGNTTMAAPEQAYNVGLIACFGYASAGLPLIVFAPLALRIKKLMPNGCTSGDFIRIRFGKAVWGLYLLLSAWYFIGCLITQAMAGGILLQALSGTPYLLGMLVVMVVCTIYTLMGGLKAVMATDYLLSMLILAVLFLAAIMAYSTFGAGAVYDGVMMAMPERMNLISGAGLMYLGSNFLFAAGEIFHSNQWWQRVYASKDTVAAKSFILSGLIWMTVPVVAGSLAFVAIANGYVVPQVNMVFPIVVSQLLGKGGSILVLVIIYAALASTVSSILTTSSNLIVQDIYKQLINPNVTDDQIVKYNRYVIVGLSLFAILLSWKQLASMYQILLFCGPAVACMVWPITYGLYNKKTNTKIVFASMLSGFVVGLIAYFLISSYAGPIVSAIVSGLILAVGTKMHPNTEFKWKSLNESMQKAIK